MSDKIKNLTLDGLSGNIWSVIGEKDTPYVEVADYAEDTNNFVEIKHIPELISWLQSVYDSEQGVSDESRV